MVPYNRRDCVPSFIPGARFPQFPGKLIHTSATKLQKTRENEHMDGNYKAKMHKYSSLDFINLSRIVENFDTNRGGAHITSPIFDSDVTFTVLSSLSNTYFMQCIKSYTHSASSLQTTAQKYGISINFLVVATKHDGIHGSVYKENTTYRENDGGKRRDDMCDKA